MSVSALFENLCSELALSAFSAEKVILTGADPIYPMPFRIGEAAAAVLALQGVMLNALRVQQGMPQQHITVDCRSAAASTCAVAFQRQNGHNWQYNDPDYPTTDFYLTGDNRWIFLHGGYPKLRDAILNILDVPNNRTRIAQAVAGWNADYLESTLADAGLCGAVARTSEEWLAHPQGRAVNKEPLIRLTKVSNSAPRARHYGFNQTLQSLRVLDFTHVIAGPTATRELALMGADVLHISSPNRPRILPFDVDTNHGKRNAYLDLSVSADRQTAARLVRDGDVFVQSYRPEALSRYGLSISEMVSLNPHLIAVNLNCYGHTGPWKTRPGFEQLAQTCTGMAMAQGENQKPQLGPTYPNDYLTGDLATLGVLMALERQAREGGAWQVDVSLCRTATWLQQQGQVTGWQKAEGPGEEWIVGCVATEHGPFGELQYFNTALLLDKTPLRFTTPAMPLGAHLPVWSD